LFFFPLQQELIMITATATTKILVELSECEGIGFATVDLHGDVHGDLYQMYKRLPNVIEANGRLYGKSCWCSDKHKAYYRTDKDFATVK
jgi:hypothetical protein